MSALSGHMAPKRHQWLSRFESAPEEAFGELLAGYADIRPYERADAPDAAWMLFGALDAEDSARKALGPAVLAWLGKQLRAPLPAVRSRLQRRVREISEAFEIVALLQLSAAAVDLRRHRLRWNDWVARLILSPARDARAEYWRMLALTQSLIADANPDIDAIELAPMWQEICREAGGCLPSHYLSIGLLGLRRLPEVEDHAARLPWMAGLAQWALAQHPSDKDFKAEWLALKPLYPRAPRSWRSLVATLLSAPTFKEKDIKAPAWWHVDPDFASMARGGSPSSGAPLRSPSPEDCDRVVGKLNWKYKDVEPLIDELLQGHRRYLKVTGDSQYFVRAVRRLGRALIERNGDCAHLRMRKVQDLAREGLSWEPYNPYLWPLWRDALAADGAIEAAEEMGWEYVRRCPTIADARAQLAKLLAERHKYQDAESLLREGIERFPDNSVFYGQLAELLAQLEKYQDAESLLRESIERFPDNPILYGQLAELLISQGRIIEAATIVDAALNVGLKNSIFFAIKARLLSNEGRIQEAKESVEEGLLIEPANSILKEYKRTLFKGRRPPLKSRAFQRIDSRAPSKSISDVDMVEDLANALRLGSMRRLRFRLELGDREAAMEQLEQVLREDPTFIYAELLAARHRLWDTEADLLPPFAVAFEDALAREDSERLRELARRHPRLEALLFVALALLGNAEAQQKVDSWLRETQTVEKEPVIAGLRSALRPLLRVIEGGRSMNDAVTEVRGMVVSALRDASEATVGEILLAA